MKKLIICAAILMAAPATAQTFNSGTVAAGTSATVGADSDSDTDSASTGVAPSAIGVSVISSAGVGNDGTASAFSGVNASWASASAGSVRFNWGWTAATNTATGVATNGVSDGWTYSFTTGAAPSQFIANWVFEAVGSPSTFGLQTIYGTGGLPFNAIPFNLSPSNGSGSFVVNLAANTSYTFGLFNFGNVSGGSSGDDETPAFGLNEEKSALAIFDWRIVSGAVPEPGTWAMMILGFGVIGGALRSARRRPRVNVAFRAA
jgi:hypothetical protein